MASHAPAQDQRLLGYTATVPRLHGSDTRSRRATTGIARGRRRAGTAAACRAGGVVVPTDGSTPRRRRLRRHVLWRRQLRTGSESNARSRPRRRTVRERLRREWQHPRTGLPIAGLQRRPHRFVSLAGRADLRHRRPQFEGRVSAHLHDRRPHVDDQRPEPDVPIRQRRAEPVDTVDLAVGQQRPGGLAGPICPGSMDARSADAAGSRAIRPGVELVPQATGRTVAVPSDAYHHRRNTGSRQLQGRDATDGRGLRRERDRQDCAEDDPRQVPRWRRRVRHVRQHQSLAAHAADDVGVRHRRGDTRLDRRQSEFRTRLRSDERRGTRSSRRGRRSVRHRLEHELRQERAHEQFRSGIARRLGRPAVRLASWRLDRAADRLAIVGRRHLHPPLVRRVFARGQPRAAGVRSDAIQHRGASRPSIA